MTQKRRTRVLAIAPGDTLELVQEALGDLVAIVHCVDLRRLRRDYGAAVAGEVLRQLVSARLRAQDAEPALTCRKSVIASTTRLAGGLSASPGFWDLLRDPPSPRR